MNLNNFKIVLASLLVASVVCFVGVHAYSTIYFDREVQCLSSSLKGVKSDVAAREIANACELLLERDEPFVGVALTDVERELVAGRAEIRNPRVHPTLNGRLYNGNNSVSVKSVIVLVEFKKDDEVINSSHYVVSKKIMPLTAADFSIPIVTYDGDFSWSIDGAIGEKVKISVK
ncbi:hypothetical protein P5G63_19735 [Aeromonas salmonicida]|uniref:hypothetical protein n=1 Tax=Aeromonas salmonicida TaxID=645 RepID=UPI0022405EA3|nr:hypothetical protein [Aeromonas salmonicida]MDF8330596.1 hypothetical protein [Aeromonas salmonicida]